ncbi:MAG TPA: YbjN domain-containing protein [Candidatus Limnocylindria bacterium]|nr:YbjN domain-containing protein [Candidatus Limnocylindria bacterium]
MTGSGGVTGPAAANDPADGNGPAAAGQAAQVEGWLRDLGLEPVEQAEREGVHSWDVLLDGRRRKRVRLTLILDPGLALVGWVHYAPPLSDNFRKTYRQLLRWNDELPFAKFAVSEDERPALTAELPAAGLERDGLGLLIARLLAICDLLYPESKVWVDRIKLPRGTLVEAVPSPPAGTRLLERYATQLGELGQAAVTPEARQEGPR